MGAFSSVIWSTVFVLSTNSDCTALLKKIDSEHESKTKTAN